jgi:hypothetical protein
MHRLTPEILEAAAALLARKRADRHNGACIAISHASEARLARVEDQDERDAEMYARCDANMLLDALFGVDARTVCGFGQFAYWGLAFGNDPDIDPYDYLAVARRAKPGRVLMLLFAAEFARDELRAQAKAARAS